MTMNFTQKKKIISGILNDNVLEYPLDDEKRLFIQKYVMQHHRNIDDIQIKKIWTKKSNVMPHNNFYYNGTCDGEEVIGGLLGLSNVASNKNHVTKANNIRRIVQGMREAIIPDLEEFKKEYWDDQESCLICGRDFASYNDIHVDHCGSMEFRHIRDAFLESGPNLIPIDRDDNDVGLTKLLDNEDKQLWITYHKLKCSLQLVCPECNLSKGKK